MKKRDFLKLSSAATAGLAFGAAAPPGAYAQSTAGTLRVAMTAADIPLTTGQPNQGAEGVRFMGITVYDGLTRWDLSKSDVAAKIGRASCRGKSVDSGGRVVINMINGDSALR